MFLALDVARERGVVRRRDVFGWIALALMASTSFGMGIAIGCTPLLVLLLGPDAGLERNARTAVWLVPLATIVVYVTVQSLHLQDSGMFYYQLMSPSAVLGAWSYALSMISVMVPYALSVLMVGFLGAPRTDPAMWRLIVGAACIVAVIAAALRMRALDRRRLLAAAVAMMAYGLAVAGCAPPFQQTVWPPGEAAVISLHYYTCLRTGIELSGFPIVRAARRH